MEGGAQIYVRNRFVSIKFNLLKHRNYFEFTDSIFIGYIQDRDLVSAIT